MVQMLPCDVGIADLPPIPLAEADDQLLLDVGVGMHAPLGLGLGDAAGLHQLQLQAAAVEGGFLARLLGGGLVQILLIAGDLVVADQLRHLAPSAGAVVDVQHSKLIAEHQPHLRRGGGVCVDPELGLVEHLVEHPLHPSHVLHVLLGLVQRQLTEPDIFGALVAAVIAEELSVPQLGAVQGAALLAADGTVLFCEQVGKESHHGMLLSLLCICQVRSLSSKGSPHSGQNLGG